MDYHLRQWRNQRESEHLPSAKIPRLLEQYHHQEPSAAALPLFVPEPYNKMGNLSALPDHSNTTSRFAKMGGLFSLAQWQELEVQALIFKYMLAGAAVPAELVQSIKKSLLNSSPASACHLHQYPFQHFHPPAELQSGYWGRVYVDPEPNRCRRTDGKKWRCSKDVVTGQKYCERHMHRGRNRSRKHVETPTETNAGVGLETANAVAALPLTMVAGRTHVSLCGSSPEIDLLQLNQRSLELEPRKNGDLLDNHRDNSLSDVKHQVQVLRHFFDDWPKSQQEPNASSAASSTRLSMSISSQDDQSSNFFLKLSTGSARDKPSSGEDNFGAVQVHRSNWEAAGWGTQQVSSMGGPLAEALRSSTSGSPVSVLHELPSGSRSRTSSAST